jgi:hypothetical protein
MMLIVSQGFLFSASSIAHCIRLRTTIIYILNIQFANALDKSRLVVYIANYQFTNNAGFIFSREITEP